MLNIAFKSSIQIQNFFTTSWDGMPSRKFEWERKKRQGIGRISYQIKKMTNNLFVILTRI